MSVPHDEAEAALALAEAAVPSEIVEVARRLQEAGHEAVLVGGGIRDALLGRPAEDWDLASSALPEEVQALFRRTIPTGIEHGTVTVMMRPGSSSPAGRGDGPRVPVEVTTFRGEGPYVDGRRPSAVVFHRDLREDLARRDFTINALAWDPIARTFHDPFGGLADLRAAIVRAVGNPAERFAEDGLRTMRAVRLCATRQMTIEPATLAAIGPALPVLDRVSRERVHVELFKLLAAPRPSDGLLPMVESGMWPHVLVDMPADRRTAAIAAVDAMQTDAVVRLARLVWPVATASEGGHIRVVDALDRLRPSRQERARVIALCSPPVQALEAAADDVAVRRAASALGREHLDDALSLLGVAPDRADAIRRTCAGAPLSIRELAVGGQALVDAGIAAPGKGLGELLAKLLTEALVDPGLNERERLLARARELIA